MANSEPPEGPPGDRVPLVTEHYHLRSWGRDADGNWTIGLYHNGQPVASYSGKNYRVIVAGIARELIEGMMQP